MKLYAHQRHVYEDRAHRHLYEWAQNSWQDIADDIGLLLLKAHPSKFCDVTAEPDPNKHRCAKSRQYMVKPYEAPLNVTLIPGSGRVSRQRLEKRRAVYARSRVARMTRKAG